MIRDLTNQRFGKLTALYPTDKRQTNHVIWHCRCDCGNEKDVVASRLTMGLATCCGCETSRLHDLTGRRFGRLLVIDRAENGNGHGARWNCRCDCGNKTVVYATHLERGKIQSCGCKRVDNSDISGQRRGNLVALHKTGEKNEKGKNIYLWRCDCGCQFKHTAPGKEILCPECRKHFRVEMVRKAREKAVHDPVTGLTMAALRNIQSGKLTKANTSGVRGVHWSESKQKWIASGNSKELGRYDSFEEAKEEREKFVSRFYPAVVAMSLN